MFKLYLAFKPVSSPFLQALFRAENVKLIHTTCFPHDGFSSYDFSTDLTSHARLPNEKMVLSSIKPFLKAGGRIGYG
ncbi:MAG: hypothetical protein ACP5JW_06760 [Candidatus Bathyarchaeia archaeon]